MSTVVYFRQLAAHDDWANREVIKSLRALPAPIPRALEIISHIQGTQWTWLSRMDKAIDPGKVWPGKSLDDCEIELLRLREAWDRFLGSHDLDDTYPYSNTKGEKFVSSIRDTLTHIFLHGDYHRGQIVLLIRQTGATPPYIDFIESVRKGYLNY